MNFLHPGVQFFALTDGTTTVNIDGNCIDPASTLTKTVLTRGVSARGGVKKTNENWELDMQFSEKEDFTALDALPDAPNYTFSIVKLNGFVFWNEAQHFTLEDSVIFDPTSEDYPFGLNMTDIRGDADIQQSVNAATPWADLDGDGLADGYSTGATTTSFSGGVQTIGAATNFNLSKILLLPFEGLMLEMGVTFDVLHADGQNEMRIIVRDINNNAIQTDNLLVNSTGRHTLTSVLPANAHTINFQPIRVSGVTVETTPAQISQPTLRIDNNEWFNG